MNKFIIKPEKIDDLQKEILYLKENNVQLKDLPNCIIQHFSYIIIGIINKRLKAMNNDLYGYLMEICLISYNKYDINHPKKASFNTFLNENLKHSSTEYINNNIIYVNKLDSYGIKKFTKLKIKLKIRQLH